jgi:hypothetical protein
VGKKDSTITGYLSIKIPTGCLNGAPTHDEDAQAEQTKNG